MPLLEFRNVTVTRGSKTVLQDISMSVDAGEVTALLGANGAGKSSLVLAAAGVLPLEAGTILLDGNDLTKRSIPDVRAAGLAVVPEGHRVLGELSVSDNLDVAGAAVSVDRAAAGREKALGTFPELAERLEQPAGSMSGGQQQMLAIAQAIVCQPKAIIIDEMSLGLAPLIVKRLMSVVKDLRDLGVAVLLIEQFAQLALEISDHAVVLDLGKMVYSGPAKDLQDDPAILRSAYLGG